MKNPIWKGNKNIEVVKNDSLTAMEHHANKQIESLKEQAKGLVKQAEEIKERVELAYLINNAEFGFKPVLLIVLFITLFEESGTIRHYAFVNLKYILLYFTLI